MLFGWNVKTALFLFVAALLASSTAHAAPIMTIDIGGTGSSANLGIGSTVTVSLYGDEIPVGTDGNGLFGFGFAISYDDTLLSSSAATAGALWVSAGYDEFRNDPGDVGMTANRYFMSSGPTGDDILFASIDFTGIAAGLSSLTVSYYNGAGENILFDMTELDGSPSFFQSGSIEVVPEPQTALLLGMGLTFLGVQRRRMEFGRTR
jgi:hypothetical protein